MNTIILRRSDFRDSSMFDGIAEQLGAEVTENREPSKEDEMTIEVRLVEYVEGDDDGYDDENYDDGQPDEMTEWNDFDPDC